MNAHSPLERLPTHERRLANGLTVLVREDRSTPVVAIVTHVKAGYFDEPDDLVGISHVLEHMFFKGTERLGPGEIARRTKAAGGYLNAGTSYDYTSYYTVLPSEALELGLELQSDALMNALIDADELRRELEVIIEEAKRKLDNPRAVATESLYETMFDVHRMRRWRIGTEEGLRRLTSEEVRGFYRDHYRASNTILIVAGDVDAERTFELVERHYEAMPGGEPIRTPSPEEPERVGPRFREMEGAVTQCYLEWGWRTPHALHEDSPALDLLAAVLGQGRASRLYRGVREHGLVRSIGAYHYTPTEIGVFGVSAEAAPDDAEAAIEAVDGEVQRIRAGRVEEHEVARARNILEARFLRRMETVEGQARLLADWQALGDWRRASRYLDSVLALTADDLLRVADRYLMGDRVTRLRYGPGGEGKGGGKDGGKGIEADVEGTGEGVGVEGTGEGVAADGEAGAGGAVGERIGGIRRGEVERVREGDGEVHSFDLEDGLRVVVAPRRGAPLVSMGVAVRGGALHEDEGRAGITGLLARASLKGTPGRSAARIAEDTEALGGAIAPSVGADLTTWSLGLPSRHFEAGFEVLADVVFRPTLPEAEVDRERKIALGDLEVLRDDMFRYPLRLFFEQAFRGHPYGLSLEAAESALTRVGREELEAWHRAEVLDARPLVMVVGDVDPDEAAATVAARLGAVRGVAEVDAASAESSVGTARAATEKEAVYASGAAERSEMARWPERTEPLVVRRAKAQTALVVGFPGPARNDPDRYAMSVLANAISGLGGRLFEELRSRRSLAYTVTAFPISRWRGGAFAAYIATSPEREDEARAGLLEEFERLSEEPLSADELERSKRYTIGTWKIRGQTNGARLAELAHAMMLGAGLEELRAFEDRVRSVTADEIRDAVRRHLDFERRVEVVVRGGAEGDAGA